MNYWYTQQHSQITNALYSGLQQLKVCTSNARGEGSVPGWGTKIPHAVWHGNWKKKQTRKQMHYTYWEKPDRKGINHMALFIWYLEKATQKNRCKTGQ